MSRVQYVRFEMDSIASACTPAVASCELVRIKTIVYNYATASLRRFD